MNTNDIHEGWNEKGKQVVPSTQQIQDPVPGMSL